MMQLEIVSKETIKPLFSTPPELKLHHLCLFDRHAPYLYLQFLYFYQNGSNSKLLKHSLSKALTFYYPFAGRLKDDCSIDCNDMGVTFLEARLRCSMPEFMDVYDLQRDEALKLVCFDDMNDGKDQRYNPLLCVQLTRFECGGEVLCVFLSHKLADASTFTNFMNHWASVSRSGGHDMPLLPPPRFDAASLFEAATANDILGEGSEIVKRDKNLVSKRLVFKGSKIAALKAMVCDKVENPSRVQILAAFIYKAAISASTSTVSIHHSKTHITNYLLRIAINLRTRLVPPMPTTLSGNIISFFLTSTTTAEKKEIELSSLLSDMKRNMEEFCNKYLRNYKAEEWSSLYKLHIKESMERMNNPEDQIVYACSSWCRFPFYDADFGWGKPVWITTPIILNKNVIILMDAKDGEGIEAFVSLEKEEMAVFEQNEELLSYCELKS